MQNRDENPKISSKKSEKSQKEGGDEMIHDMVWMFITNGQKLYNIYIHFDVSYM